MTFSNELMIFKDTGPSATTRLIMKSRASIPVIEIFTNKDLHQQFGHVEEMDIRRFVKNPEWWCNVTKESEYHQRDPQDFNLWIHLKGKTKGPHLIRLEVKRSNEDYDSFYMNIYFLRRNQKTRDDWLGYLAFTYDCADKKGLGIPSYHVSPNDFESVDYDRNWPNKKEFESFLYPWISTFIVTTFIGHFLRHAVYNFAQPNHKN